MSASMRSAREVVEAYNLVAWNNCDLAVANEIIGHEVIRHDVDETHTLSHAEAVQRIAEIWKMFQALRFELRLVIAGDDGEHVTIVYESHMTLTNGEPMSIASMEVFRVVDGRIVEVYNCGHKQGVWR